MGAIAEQFCNYVILTNEDPYDEYPQSILDQMQAGMSVDASVDIILDRRTAIKTAIAMCPVGGYVLISGKGTDPYIMGPNDTKQEWSDAKVVKQLLQELTIAPESL
jgi:UDP-N-acetylmuramoyl-L-alanyl-D-glutamate--2,6-diaminopimelate ligase